MMSVMRRKFSRRLATYALVLAASVLSTVSVGRAKKPFSPAAPEFRRKGGAGAPLEIVEFSDFQCPACRYAEAPLRQIFSVYDGKIRFVFKHYPLPPRVHAWAKVSALAAECAGRQGKFWEFHDRLYDKQTEWSNEKAEIFFASYARDLKLDVPAWDACRTGPDAAAAIASDMEDGNNAWVASTPTFFINGRRFVGGKQLAELGTLFMDRELKHQ